MNGMLTATKPHTNGAKKSSDAEKDFDPRVIVPTGCRILLERIEAPNATRGGILLTQQIQQDERKRSKRCRVVALGPGQLASTEDKFLPLVPERDTDGNPTTNIAAGDEVVIADYGFTEFDWNGKQYLFISAEDIKAIIR